MQKKREKANTDTKGRERKNKKIFTEHERIQAGAVRLPTRVLRLQKTLQGMPAHLEQGIEQPVVILYSLHRSWEEENAALVDATVGKVVVAADAIARLFLHPRDARQDRRHWAFLDRAVVMATPW